MLQKSLLILAIAAACTSVQAQSTPAKKELVARILKVQQPGIENMARALVQEPLVPLLERAGAALQQRVPPEKREAVGKEIQADARKFADETSALVRDRATKLAPGTVGPMLEEKFTEDELKQVIAMLESPVLAKFNAAGGEMQRALIDKVVADTRGIVEPRFRTLEESIAKRLGLPAGPAADGKAPAAGSKPPARK
jgi:hypothetical protein